mmetsp:Transcript_92473/g.138504  ORF Transcript_92473/g.138504 Transcript_92473/m.138504 type:complete len:208 (+) Transcript_92473:215-838(+)
MGIYLAKLASVFDRTRDARILLVGLDGAGKTTLLYKFKLNETVTTIPTIGFNTEEVQYKNIRFSMWDVGGQEKIRALWKHYYVGCSAVIFMVDSADRDRLSEAKDELQNMLNDDELRDAIVLVMANKQDLPNAASTDTVAQALQLRKLGGNRFQCASTRACSFQTGGRRQLRARKPVFLAVLNADAVMRAQKMADRADERSDGDRVV